MRGRLLILAFALDLLAANAASALPPPRFSPDVTEWRADDPAPQPGLTLEMLTALEVASARCTGSHGSMLARYKPRMLGWRRDWFLIDGSMLRFHYLRAYGERWETVLAGQVAAIRARYAAHPDPQRFCRLAAITARDGSGEHAGMMEGASNLRPLFATMIRYMDPDAAGLAPAR